MFSVGIEQSCLQFVPVNGRILELKVVRELGQSLELKQAVFGELRCPAVSRAHAAPKLRHACDPASGGLCSGI